MGMGRLRLGRPSMCVYLRQTSGELRAGRSARRSSGGDKQHRAPYSEEDQRTVLQSAPWHSSALIRGFVCYSNLRVSSVKVASDDRDTNHRRVSNGPVSEY